MIGKRLRRIEKGITEKFLSKIHLGISPNWISAATLIPSLAAMYFIFQKHYLVAVVMILISVLLDMLDGAIARNEKKATKFGAYLDPMLDKFAEAFIYLGLFLSGFKLEAFLAFTGILLIGSAKSWAFLVIPLKNFDWPALGERAERYVILLLSFVIAPFKETVYDIPVISIALWIIIAMVYLGTIQRMVFAKKLITRK